MMISDSRLQSELDAGETLLWQGAPDPARLAQRNTLVAVFGGCFTLFALGWMLLAGFIATVIASATGWKIVGLVPLFGLIFLVAGVVMLVSPLTARKRGARMVYALTDRRILICEPGKTRSFSGVELNTLERNDLRNGRGDLIFRRDTHFDSEGSRSVQEEGFFGIPDAREVERLIRAHLKT